MGIIHRILAMSIVALVLVSGASVALGDGPYGGGHESGMPTVTSHENSIIVSNGKIIVQFQGFKPMLHIFYRNNSNTTGFTVDVRGVYELNSSGTPVAVLSTVRAFPDFGEINGSTGIFNYSSGVSITYDNSSKMVNITFALTSEEFSLGQMNANRTPDYSSMDQQGQWTGGIGLMQPMRSVGPGSIAVTFHINESTAHVKFDLSVNKWTWLNNTGDKLALVVAVTGHQTIEDSQGDAPTFSGTNVGDRGNDSNWNPGQAPAGQDSISVMQGTQGSFLKLGFVSWGSTAIATYSNHTTTPLNVSVKMFSHGIEYAGMAHIWFVFTTPAGWNTNYTQLSYDPTVGLSGTASVVPSVGTVAAAGLIVLAAAVGAGAIIIRRFRH